MDSTIRFRNHCVWACLALALTVWAIGVQDAKAGGGTLVWAQPASETILDPHVACGSISMYTIYHITEGLWDQNLNSGNSWTDLTPRLAKSWDISDDGRVHTFYLQEGVTFHDGHHWDAEVANWNYDRFMNEEAEHYYAKGAAYMGHFTKFIESYEVVDPMTFRVTLKNTQYEWMRNGVLSCGSPRMVSPAAVEKWGDDEFAAHPVGTGPFVFESMNPGEKIVLSRNDDYWGKKAILDGIVFVSLEDQATRVNALYAGEVHGIDEVPFDLIQDLQDDGFIYSMNPDNVVIYFIAFNFKNPAMQDIRVRKAINMAIDRENISSNIMAGASKPAWGMLSAGTYAYDPDFVSYPYDPEGAKKLLAEAGYADGLEIDFDIFQYGYGEVWEKQIQRDLKKVGITVNLNLLEWGAYLQKWLAGMPEDLEMNEMGWGQGTPAWTTFHTLCDGHAPASMNIGWYCNEKVDELLNKAYTVADRGEAAKLWQEASRIIMMEDAGYAPLFHYHRPVMLSPKLKNFSHSIDWWYDFTEVWIED